MARFRTSARAVDMLGRQQIAGVPTAVSELFKNAHDAYATEVHADLIRELALFVLRDDGRGMTRDEFIDRWLTLGTDNKLTPQPTPRGFRKRPMLGEKGIGRLAIALLGPQVLVLTRPKVGRSGGDLTMALINWRMFELPGVSLEDIEIPIRTADTRGMVDDGLSQLVEESIVAVDSLVTIMGDSPEIESIRAELLGFSPNMTVLDDYLGAPSLLGDGHGTHFVISPFSDALTASLEPPKGGEVSDLVKLLVGFSNTMVPDSDEPRIRVLFRDHKSGDDVVSITDESEFFTPEDFLAADHRVRGEFDINGWFTGTVEVYGAAPQEYKIPPPSEIRQPSSCGPFTFDMAAIQGQANESTITPEAYGALDRKTNRMGGLYIYRDAIRVLPYGSIDFDFLEIEKRRTLGAGYYYFSHRNLFGAISITRERNPGLIDKAGREGLQQNRAYRIFRDLLINLFLQLAADFFRKDGVGSSPYLAERDRLKALRKAQVAHEKRARTERDKLGARLGAAWEYLQSGDLDQDIAKLKEWLSERLGQELSPTSLARIERDAARRLRDMRSRLVIHEPEGVGLGSRLASQLDDYHARAVEAEDDLISPCEAWIEEVVRGMAATMGEDQTISWVDQWAEGVVADTQGRVTPVLDVVSEELDRLQAEFGDLRASIDEDLRELRLGLDKAVRELAAKGEGQQKMLDERLDLVTALEHWATLESTLSTDIAMLQLVSIRANERDEQPLAALKALEEEVLAHRERAELDMEMIQLGMAVDVLSHEFDDSIRAVRNNLRRLSAWANANPDLAPLHQDLSSAFAHLDGYLKLLTPLSRRLARLELP